MLTERQEAKSGSCTNGLEVIVRVLAGGRTRRQARLTLRPPPLLTSQRNANAADARFRPALGIRNFAITLALRRWILPNNRGTGGSPGNRPPAYHAKRSARNGTACYFFSAATAGLISKS